MNQLVSELNTPPSRDEGGTLATLWRNILKENNYYPVLDYYVSEYVKKTEKLGGGMKAAGRKTKSSLIKNITSPSMTWKVFLDLIFNYLNSRRADISIKITNNLGIESIHSISIKGEKTQLPPVLTDEKTIRKLRDEANREINMLKSNIESLKLVVDDLETNKNGTELKNLVKNLTFYNNILNRFL